LLNFFGDFSKILLWDGYAKELIHSSTNAYGNISILRHENIFAARKIFAT
jgi:hypothetical protein